MLARPVAIKFIAAIDPDPGARQRFLLEARAVAQIHHPNVVGIYRVGTLHNRPYFVTELVRGESLAERCTSRWRGRPRSRSRSAWRAASPPRIAAMSSIAIQAEQRDDRSRTGSPRSSTSVWRGSPDGGEAGARAGGNAGLHGSRGVEWRGADRAAPMSTRWAPCCSSCSPARRRSASVAPRAREAWSANEHRRASCVAGASQTSISTPVAAARRIAACARSRRAMRDGDELREALERCSASRATPCARARIRIAVFDRSRPAHRGLFFGRRLEIGAARRPAARRVDRAWSPATPASASHRCAALASFRRCRR